MRNENGGGGEMAGKGEWMGERGGGVRVWGRGSG